MHQVPTDAAPTRRRLLAAAGLGVAGIAAGGAAAAKTRTGTASSISATGSGLPYSLRNGGLAEWSSLVGESFAVGRSGAVVKLIAVSAFPTGGRRPASLPRSHAFAAHFETRSHLPEGIYRLAHGLFSSVDVHLAPVLKNRLTAVFN
jgi:hypothetical protein